MEFIYNTNKEDVNIELTPYKLCFDENHLRKKVTDCHNAVSHVIIKRMFMTLEKYSGIGLSANQCYINERLFVISSNDFKLTCINPIITRYSDVTEVNKEFCLSFPGLVLKINRSKEIDVTFFNEQGKLQQNTYQGVTARVFQQQLDLLNGIPYTLRVGPVALKLATQRQLLLLKKSERKIK